MVEVYKNRLKKLRAAMIDAGVGAVITTPGANMRYFSGYSEEGHERLLCLAIPLAGEPILLVPAINEQNARQNPAGIADIRAWTDDHGWRTALGTLFCDLALEGEPIAIDDEMPARFVLPIDELAFPTDLQLAGKIFATMRSVKDEAEIAKIKRASELTEIGLAAGIAACKLGVTERDIADAIDGSFRANGAAPSFETIVATGANSAMPHHMPGGTVVRAGDVILFDLGAVIDGYRGDITRVYSVGAASDEAHAVYEIVYRAQQAAEAAVRSGANGFDVDKAARDVIVGGGYGDSFIHRTGHGIGLDAHEEPNISAANKHALEAGNCFSIEPGIYLPGKFGVRLENIVAVAPDGNALAFNSAIPSELVEIGNAPQ